MSDALPIEALAPFLTTLPTPVIITDTAGVIKWANTKFAELTGYNVDTAAGLNAHEMSSPGDWIHRDGYRLRATHTITPVRSSEGAAETFLWTIVPSQSVPSQSVPSKNVPSQDEAKKNDLEWHSVAVSCMAEGVVFQDATGKIEMCNEAAERILGLTQDEMNGRTSVDPRWRAIHEDGTPFTGETHPSMVTLRTGEDQSNVVMGVHKPDGTLTWISINSRGAMFRGNRLSGVVTTFNDITETKRMRHILQMAEEQLAKAFLAGPNIGSLSIVQADGVVRLVRVNEAFERQTGYLKEEAVGRTIQELGLWVDSYALAAAVADFQAHGEVRGFSMRFRTKKGEIRDGLFSASTVELAGRIAAVASIEDVTEKKRAEDDLEKAAFSFAAAERHYRQLFHAVPDALLVIDFMPDGEAGSMKDQIVDVNQKACDLLGYTRDELLKLGGRDLRAPEDQPDEEVQIQSFAERGASTRDGVLIGKSGRRIPVEISARFFEQDHSRKVLATVRDRL